ncbi:histidine kinase [Crocinitomix algicola]|uniref:histidine kinase n=1 Tax=Crocinitomix algicola TaxID=1740263 RepID=UPI00083420A6|nr:histidine kinase [Crocinitomix algicola]
MKFKGLKYGFLVLLIISIMPVCLGQSKRIQPISSQKVLERLDSAKRIFDENPMEAIIFVESSIRLSIKNDLTYELALSYATLANFNYQLQEYNSVLLNGYRAIPQLKIKENWTSLYQVNWIVAKSHYHLKQYNEAYNQFAAAKSVGRLQANPSFEVKAILEQGNCLFAQERLVEAEAHFRSARVAAERSELLDLVAEIDYQLGELFLQKGEQEQATIFYSDAITNAYQSNNNSVLTRENARRVSSVKKGDLKSDTLVLDGLKQAEAHFTKVKDTNSIVQNNLQKATLYESFGNFDEAKTAVSNSLILSQKSGDIAAQLESSKKLYDLHLASNEREAASQELNNYLLLRDSLLKLQLQKKEEQLAIRAVEDQITVLEQERKLDQQTINILEREKNVNEAEIRQQRALLYALVLVLLAFGSFSFILYRNTKAKNRANQLLYLKSLRSQMNPHFIFNSLNSVNNYIATSNEKEANKYLSKFAKLMRLVLDYSEAEFISLEQEIELLKLYVELEYERFKDKFDYSFKVDEDILLSNYEIPPMIIQPFIENAIWHGLRYKGQKGELLINFTNYNDWVEISIKDDGIGRKKSQEIKTPSQRQHASSGMKNVEDRTKMIDKVFKKRINYEILDLPKDGGTEVIIKLFRYE